MAWRRPEATTRSRGALAFLALALCAPGTGGRALEWYSALVSTAYVDLQTNLTVRSVSESGRFGDNSPKEGAQGLLGAPRAPDGHPEGCAPDTRFHVPAPGGQGAAPWVALVARGGCTFKDKVLVAARRNASAVVIYNEERYGNLTAPMSHAGTGNTVVIMISYPKGRELLDLVQRGIPVKMTIGIGTRHVQEFISSQSVVFVAIAFITMMIISLAWLIFYYIQRFLYTGSQFGNQSHRKEIKKIIGQLVLHTVNRGEKGIDVDAENCAVCIENFKAKDIVRILPCNEHLLEECHLTDCRWGHKGHFTSDSTAHSNALTPTISLRLIGHFTSDFSYSQQRFDSYKPEDVQETPAPESTSGSVSAANLSVAIQDEGRSDGSNLPSSSTDESALQCSASFKDDAGENTALLEAGRSDPQRGGPVSSCAFPRAAGGVVDTAPA
ncbi:E3 ubiquitin-protein ligase RNF149 isoform 2-T2 [Trichechus inunguis]